MEQQRVYTWVSSQDFKRMPGCRVAAEYAAYIFFDTLKHGKRARAYHFFDASFYLSKGGVRHSMLFPDIRDHVPELVDLQIQNRNCNNRLFQPS